MYCIKHISGAKIFLITYLVKVQISMTNSSVGEEMCAGFTQIVREA